MKNNKEIKWKESNTHNTQHNQTGNITCISPAWHIRQEYSTLHRIAFYQSLQSEYTPLLFSAQGLQLNVLQ